MGTRGVGSKKVVIVLSFIGTNYYYVHYTKSAGPLIFFFLHHIGIQGMMAAIKEQKSISYGNCSTL